MTIKIACLDCAVDAYLGTDAHDIVDVDIVGLSDGFAQTQAAGTVSPSGKRGVEQHDFFIGDAHARTGWSVASIGLCAAHQPGVQSIHSSGRRAVRFNINSQSSGRIKLFHCFRLRS